MDEQPARSAETSQESVHDATNAALYNANDRTEVCGLLDAIITDHRQLPWSVFKVEISQHDENPISNRQCRQYEKLEDSLHRRCNFQIHGDTSPCVIFQSKACRFYNDDTEAGGLATILYWGLSDKARKR